MKQTLKLLEVMSPEHLHRSSCSFYSVRNVKNGKWTALEQDSNGSVFGSNLAISCARLNVKVIKETSEGQWRDVLEECGV